jgi:hypothetical protein
VSDARAIVCDRITDTPQPKLPGCAIRYCMKCRSAVWVAPSSLASAPGAPAMCVRCFIEISRTEPTNVLPLTIEQARDIRAYYRRRRKP